MMSKILTLFAVTAAAIAEAPGGYNYNNPQAAGGAVGIARSQSYLLQSGPVFAGDTHSHGGGGHHSAGISQGYSNGGHHSANLGHHGGGYSAGYSGHQNAGYHSGSHAAFHSGGGQNLGISASQLVDSQLLSQIQQLIYRDEVRAQQAIAPSSEYGAPLARQRVVGVSLGNPRPSIEVSQYSQVVPAPSRLQSGGHSAAFTSAHSDDHHSRGYSSGPTSGRLNAGYSNGAGGFNGGYSGAFNGGHSGSFSGSYSNQGHSGGYLPPSHASGPSGSYGAPF